jgi:TRAP-type C4-dicarboxylate transport system permease large subunit
LLVSFGNTNSVIITSDSLAVLSIPQNFAAKIINGILATFKKAMPTYICCRRSNLNSSFIW